MTVNELRCFTDLGHLQGVHAPGLQLPPAEVNQVRHHGVLAHGLGVQAIARPCGRARRSGIADNTNFYVPVMETPEHIEAAKKATRDENAMFLTAIMEGRYIDEYLPRRGGRRRAEGRGRRHGGDRQPARFRRAQRLPPVYARAPTTGRAAMSHLPHLPSSPRMASPWLYVGPEVIYWARAQRQRAVGPADALHLREWLLGRRPDRRTGGSMTATG